MAGKQTLAQEQKLTQRLSPLQLLLVPLLQMNRGEIEEEVRREMDDNPALEVSEDPQTEMLNKDEDGEVFNETPEQMQDADYKDEDDIPYYRMNVSNRSADDEAPNAVVIAEGIKYLRIVAFSYVLMGITQAYLYIMRSVERVVISTVLNVSALLLNIVLNAALVFGWFGLPRMGIAGVALASILSQYVSAGLILRALVKSSGDFALRPAQLRLYPGKTQTLLALGIPAGCQNAIFALANLFIQSGINSFDTLTVQGHSAAANSDALVYDVMAAFYMACASFMSQNYGAGKPERVRRSYFISLGFSFGIGAVMGLSLVAFGRPFLSLFTTDPAVVEAGMQRLIIMGLSYPISAFMDCTIAASRGLGHTVVPTVLVILGSCVFRVIWVYTVFAYFHTVESLYLVFVCSWLVTALAEAIYFVLCYRKQMAVFSAA